MLVGKWSGVWKPLERSILAEVGSRLDPKYGTVFESQVGQINRVQRLTVRRTECNMYRLVPFRVERARDHTFPFPAEECVLAKVRFDTFSGLRQLVQVYVVNGNLFSLEFGGDVRRHLSSTVSSVVSFVQLPS